MTKEEKKKVLEMPTVATCWEDYSGGVEIKEIQYGIDDYCLCVTQSQTIHPRVHRVKIHYEEERAYVIIDSFRVYMDNCIRC